MKKQVDRHAAARFLAERYGSRARDVAELAGGDWSLAVSFRLGDRDLVARFGQHLEAYVKDQRAMAFARPELPIPAVLEVGAALGGYYAISERYSGGFLGALDEQGWQTVMPVLLRALDALREIEPPGTGVEWARGDEAASPGWRAWLDERAGGWRATLTPAPEIEEVLLSGERALRSLLSACPEVRHIVHRDLLNRNVLAAQDASRLEAVLDWGCAVAGDFLYEIAWFTFWAPWYPALMAIDFRRVIREHYATVGLDVERFDERLSCYELGIGLDHIAYFAFTGRDADQRAVARRTKHILEPLSC